MSTGDNDAMSLALAAKVVRKKCFIKFVLKTRYKVRSHGLKISYWKVPISNTKVSLSLLQLQWHLTPLMMFNSVEKTRGVGSATVHYRSEHETPTPVYVALKIHVSTCSRINRCTI